MICPNCKKKLSNADRFCPECGFQFPSSDDTATQNGSMLIKNLQGGEDPLTIAMPKMDPKTISMPKGTYDQDGKTEVLPEKSDNGKPVIAMPPKPEKADAILHTEEPGKEAAAEKPVQEKQKLQKQTAKKVHKDAKTAAQKKAGPNGMMAVMYVVSAILSVVVVVAYFLPWYGVMWGYASVTLMGLEEGYWRAMYLVPVVYGIYFLLLQIKRDYEQISVMILEKIAAVSNIIVFIITISGGIGGYYKRVSLQKGPILALTAGVVELVIFEIARAMEKKGKQELIKMTDANQKKFLMELPVQMANASARELPIVLRVDEHGGIYLGFVGNPLTQELVLDVQFLNASGNGYTLTNLVVRPASYQDSGRPDIVNWGQVQNSFYRGVTDFKSAKIWIKQAVN